MVQTRPHYSFFEAARDGQEHSTLEVEQPALEVDDSHHDPNSYHPKGVDEGAVNDSPVGWHEKEGEDTTITATKKPLYRRKRFIVLGIALLLILVGAVVGGAVGGTLSHKNNRTSSQELSNSTTSSTHSSPSTTSPTLSSQIGTVVPTSSPSTAPFISNLASVSYTDQDNVPQRRLYHQDSKGILKESAWNGSDQEWYISTEALALAKPGSPLAAARTPDPDGVVSANSDQASGFMLTGSHLQQLNVYCVSPDGHLIEIYLSSDGGTMDRLPLGKLPLPRVPTLRRCGSVITGVKTATERLSSSPTKTAATPFNLGISRRAKCNGQHYEPTLCLGVVWLSICYQDRMVLLLSACITKSTAVDLSPLIMRHEVANPIPVSCSWNLTHPCVTFSFFQGCCADVLRLDNHRGWNLHEDFNIDILSDRAPLASFISSNIDNEGAPYLMEVLSSSSHGVTVDWWSSSQAPSLQNSQSPEVMAGVQNYSAIAANGDGHVYAFQDGVVKEFTVSEDGLRWSLVGNVDTVAP
ncbi:MAG: hypothetical protein Q9190_000075 [Brigantiaea leucoxantha]